MTCDLFARRVPQPHDFPPGRLGAALRHKRRTDGDGDPRGARQIGGVAQKLPAAPTVVTHALHSATLTTTQGLYIYRTPIAYVFNLPFEL